MNRKIVQTGSDNHENHRQDFETCPSCGYHASYDVWDKLAATLIINPNCYKAGNVAVMAECPKCFTDSWVHIAVGGWEYTHENWPKKWRKAVDELEEYLKLKAVRDCAFSLCGKCANLKTMKVDYHAYRTCSIGMGPVVTECESFQELKKP